MKLSVARSRLRQRGVAAVELAILLPILVFSLAPLVLLGQYMWHYTIVHKAAQDAARFMSTVPVTEMNSRILAGRARDVAQEIVRRELGDLVPEDESTDPGVYCDDDDCGSVAGVPQTVRVVAVTDFYDRVFLTYFGARGIEIKAEVTMNYVGR